MRDTGLVTGYWPALDHISKPSAGSYHPDAIWLYSQRFIGRARHKPERARQLRRIYRASVRASSILGERRLSARGGMQPCCGVPDSEFRIPNSASPFPAQRTISSLSPIINRIVRHPSKAAFSIFSYCVPLNFAHSHKKTAARNSDYKSRSAVTFYQSRLCTFCIYPAFYAFARHFVAKYPCLLTAAL